MAFSRSRSLVLLLGLVALPAPLAALRLTGFEIGAEIKFQCRDWESGEWTYALRCGDDKDDHIAFRYADEAFFRCAFHLEGDLAYQYYEKVVAQNETILCRVPHSADEISWIPVPLPLWGVVETAHFHVNNHMNVIFHAHEGFILGVSMYPILDRFQLVAPPPNSHLTLHGPVRWFHGHDYEKLIHGPASEPAACQGYGLLTLAMTGIVSALASVLVLAVCYFKRGVLPIVGKLVKKD